MGKPEIKFLGLGMISGHSLSFASRSSQKSFFQLFDPTPHTGRCRHCDTELTLDTIDAHRQETCPNVTVRCKFRPYGCLWSGARHQGHECRFSSVTELLELYRALKIDHYQLQTNVHHRIAVLEVQQLNARRRQNNNNNHDTLSHMVRFCWTAFVDPASIEVMDGDRRRPRRVAVFQFLCLLPTFIVVGKFVLAPLVVPRGYFLGTNLVAWEDVFCKVVALVFGAAMLALCVTDVPKIISNALRLERSFSDWCSFFLSCVSGVLCVSLYDLVVTCYGPERSRTLWWVVSIGSWFPASVLWGLMSPARRLDPQGKHVSVLWGLGMGWSLQEYSEMQCLMAMSFFWTFLYLLDLVLSRSRVRTGWLGKVDNAATWGMDILLLRELAIKLPFQPTRRRHPVILFVLCCLHAVLWSVNMERFLRLEEAPFGEAALSSMHAGAIYSILSLAGQAIGKFIKAKVRRDNSSEFSRLLSYGVLIVWVGSLIKLMLV